MINIIKTIIVGIVQGLTEFLPVSSSGHIRIFKEIFNLSEEGLVFDVLLHFGTLIAVFIFYRKDILELIKEFFSLVGDVFSFGKRKILIREKPYRVLLIMLIVTAIPTGIAGLLLNGVFDVWFSSIIVVGISLLVTCAMMYAASVVPEGKKEEKDMTFKDALFVGLCQCLAIAPGVSRSGATIFGGRLSGFAPELAVKYAFLCSLPTVLGAVVLKVGGLFEQSLSNEQIIGYIGAFIAATIVGYFSLKMLDMMARRKNLKPFAYYCAAAGLFCIIYGIVA